MRTLKEYIDVNMAKGFIRASNSSARAAVLFLLKPGGEKRLCVDYRKLNDITIKDRDALPLADELRDRLQGARIFTKLDLRSAYSQIRIKEGEEWKTAFGCRCGYYEYLVMPFGLTNAPAAFQRMINDVLREFFDACCIVYLDDILVYSQNVTENTQHVTRILQKLDDANLRLKDTKCELHVKETKFLGFNVSNNGLSLDAGRIQAVTEWQRPSNIKDV